MPAAAAAANAVSETVAVFGDSLKKVSTKRYLIGLGGTGVPELFWLTPTHSPIQVERERVCVTFPPEGHLRSHSLSQRQNLPPLISPV